MREKNAPDTIKNSVLKSVRPRGFVDKTASVERLETWLVQTAFNLYESFGFEPLQTPTLEYAHLIGQFLPDDDRPNQGVFSVRDDEDWLSLRYDLTAPLARFVAENYETIPKPFRRYQAGRVFRNEKPGPGRFREFTQCDADSVGAGGAAADAEMIMLAAGLMQAVGLKTGAYKIRVSNRKLIDSVLDIGGVPNTQAGEMQKLIVLRAIDKLDRIGFDGVKDLLGEGRLDESGDYTKGAQLPYQAIDILLACIMTMQGGDGGKPQSRNDVLSRMGALLDTSAQGRAGIEELRAIDDILAATGFSDEMVVFDSSIVRGLGYYTGPVFEAELCTEVKDEKGRLVQIGSIGGGGRYDGLVSRFRAQPVPATGFSFGVSRFAHALSQLNLARSETPPLVLICQFDKELQAQYFQMAQELRTHNIRTEVFVGAGALGKQLKYADKRGAHLAVIMGSDEHAQGMVSLKNLRLGAQMAKDITDNAVWRETQPAQTTIARAELASHIKTLLQI